MKKNKKADRLRFVKEAKEIILENGAMGMGAADYFAAISGSNHLHIYLYPEDYQEISYYVALRFQTPVKGYGNPFSGKFNFHSDDTVVVAIADFEDHLKKAIQLIKQ